MLEIRHMLTYMVDRTYRYDDDHDDDVDDDNYDDDDDLVMSIERLF